MTELTVISDLHHYSPALGVSGKAYTLRERSDQKVLAESGAVIKEVLKTVQTSSANALLICGDLTNNGERVCHEELLTLLKNFVQKKPVYLITSTHDWCSNGFSHRYEEEKIINDVPVLSKEELAEFYNDIIKNTEIACFKTKAGFCSRVFQVTNELRLLAVHDDCDGENGASGYSKAHLEWMVKQIKAAKADGCQVIAMEHHLLLPTVHPLLNSSQMISRWKNTADILADAGLRLMLTGHSHMQRTTRHTSENGNEITQINVGALTGYPNPVVHITVNAFTANIHVESAPLAEYNGTLLDEEFFKHHLAGVLLNLLQSGINSKQQLTEHLHAQGIGTKAVSLFYPVIRSLCKKLDTLTVGQAARFLNAFTFGRAIPKRELKDIENDRLLFYILQIFYSVFDGSKNIPSLKNTAKTVVQKVFYLPLKTAEKLPLPKKTKERFLTISQSVVEIFHILFSENNDINYDCEISLC